MGRRKGIREEQILDIGDFESSAAFSELERTVVRYALAVTATPVDVPDGLYAEMKKHFDSRQIVELTSAVAWENYRARFNHALNLEAQGFSEGAFCAYNRQ